MGNIKKKKILHVSKYYYPFVGGVEQTARDIVNSLKDEYEQKVLCFNHEDGNCEDKVDGINVIRCHCQCKISSQSLSASYGKKMKVIMQEFQPDYVIIHYPNPFATYYLLKYLMPNMKLIVYWHLDIVKQKILGKLFQHQNLELIKRADCVVATSPNYIEGSHYLSKAKEKCIVIPSCINEQRLNVTESSIALSKKIRQENQGKIICLAVGRHVEYKGFEYLVRASKLLDSNIAIYITGAGERTKDLIAMKEDDKKVNFIGLVDDDTLKAYYLAADIFCFPSITKNEAFGLALAEAMCYGNPAVTFNIKGSGVNYVSLDRVTGIEVENRNVELYAKAIKELSDDKNLRERYGKAGRNRVEENFLYAQYCENICRMMKTL